MGWIAPYHATHFKRGYVDRKAELDERYTDDNHTVLKSAIVASTYYAAVKIDNADGSSKVVAAIVLTRGGNKRQGTLWSYKDMDETEGPFYYECPKCVLDLLTPTDNETANEWRRLCEARLAEKAKERKEGKKTLPRINGLEIVEKRGRWLLTSAEFRDKNQPNYYGSFAKRSWHTLYNAMRFFIEKYGNDEQKAEFAKISVA